MTKKLLLVDDEPNLLLLYERVLGDEGYSVVVARSPGEAMDLIECEHPDLVVLDVRMPGMDGLEALGKIVDAHPRLPVIINSAYACYKDSFMSWAADDYVLKSSDLGDLKKSVARLIARRSPTEALPSSAAL